MTTASTAGAVYMGGWETAALVASVTVAAMTAISIIGSAFWVIARTTINTQNMTKAIDELRRELKSNNRIQQDHAVRLGRVEVRLEKMTTE